MLGHFDCAFDLPRRVVLEAVGSEGSVVVVQPFVQDEVTLELRRGAELEWQETVTANRYRLELDNLARAIAGEEPPLLDRASRWRRRACSTPSCARRNPRARLCSYDREHAHEGRAMTRIRYAVAAGAAVLALVVGAAPATAATKLVATVGPSFTITLKKAGKKVTTLKAGTYTITVQDKSDFHNFHLMGPGCEQRRRRSPRSRRRPGRSSSGRGGTASSATRTRAR